jgi:hypothetical protein
VKNEGYEVAHDGKCITVFSAPNYWWVTLLWVYQCRKLDGPEGHWNALNYCCPYLNPSILTNSRLVWTESMSFHVLRLQWIPFMKFSEGPRNINLGRKICSKGVLGYGCHSPVRTC